MSIYVLKNPRPDTRATTSATPTGAVGEECMSEADFIAWRDAQPEIISAAQPYPVRRDTIWQRLKAAVGTPTAHAIINGFTDEQRNEWFGNDYFMSTNPDVTAMCVALGLDPSVLLAPE